MSESIVFTVDDRVARITLNRPQVANAVDLATAEAFSAAVTKAASDENVRSVLVTGTGKRFCVGGDLSAMWSAPNREAYVRELATTFDRGLRALAAMPKPVVAAVHGAVAGAGLGVVLASTSRSLATRRRSHRPTPQ